MPITSATTVLVTGATENTSAVLLRRLEQRGIAVRAMSEVMVLSQKAR